MAPNRSTSSVLSPLASLHAYPVSRAVSLALSTWLQGRDITGAGFWGYTDVALTWRPRQTGGGSGSGGDGVAVAAIAVPVAVGGALLIAGGLACKAACCGEGLSHGLRDTLGMGRQVRGRGWRVGCCRGPCMQTCFMHDRKPPLQPPHAVPPLQSGTAPCQHLLCWLAELPLIFPTSLPACLPAPVVVRHYVRYTLYGSQL